MRTSITKGSIVDNAGAGGCFASIDVESGAICRNAYSETSAFSKITDSIKPLFGKKGMERHPLTSTKFLGFQIPFFKEAKELVVEVANNVDFYGRRLLGFDIAITEKGPLIVEVNCSRPGVYELYQIARKDTPLKKQFESMLTEDE